MHTNKKPDIIPRRGITRTWQYNEGERKNREKKEGLYNRTRGSIVGTGESIDVIPQTIKLSSNVCRKQVFS